MIKKNLKHLEKNGFLKTTVLNNKEIKLIFDEIKKIYSFEGQDKSLDEYIKNLYKTDNIHAGKCYDMLNQSALVQRIFLSDKVLNKIAFYLQMKSRSLITFADFQFLVMLPNKKKEQLGWHQDSKYFEFTKNKRSSLILWTSLRVTGKKVTSSLMLMPGSHNEGRIDHHQNHSKKIKKSSRAKRGKYFINKEKLKKFKPKTFFINSDQSLLLDSNMVHRSGPSLKNNESIRYTIVARYKSINKILNIS